MPAATLANLCTDALPRLEPTGALTTKEEHERLYEPPPHNTLKRLSLRLELGALDQRTKLVFSGHIGTGKSTALFHLKRELEAKRRITVVYVSVRDHVNLVGMNGTRLLEALARALHAEALRLGEQDAGPGIDEEVRIASERLKRVRKHAESVGGEAVLGPALGVVSAKGKLASERGVTEERVFEEQADPADMLALVNRKVAALRARRRDAPVLILCDDLEKLDLATASAVFADGLALSEIDACVVFTVPIALLFSDRRRVLLGHFDETEVLLPLVKLRERDGTPVRGGLDWVRRLVLRRVPELDRLLSPTDFDRLALASGGVLRDLIRMLRFLCLEVLLDDAHAPPGESALRHAEAEIRNNFLREIPRTALGRLREVRDAVDGRGGNMDAELAVLLNLTAVLEHTNENTWYEVHPLARYLIDDAA